MIATRSLILLVDKFIAGNQLPHMLFYGPPGTGKTSTILCVARKIYGDKAAGKGGGNYRNNVLEVRDELDILIT